MKNAQNTPSTLISTVSINEFYYYDHEAPEGADRYATEYIGSMEVYRYGYNTDDKLDKNGMDIVTSLKFMYPYAYLTCLNGSVKDMGIFMPASWIDCVQYHTDKIVYVLKEWARPLLAAKFSPEILEHIKKVAKGETKEPLHLNK